MFTKFTSRYYLRSYWVVSDEGPGRINKQEYNFVRENFYNSEDPIVMKLGTAHFQVVGDDDVPAQTLYAPFEAVETADINSEPDKAPVLLANPECAERVMDVHFSSEY